MTVETALYPSQLNTTLPQPADMVSEGDDHLRLIKTVIKTTFPNVAGAVSASHTQLSYLVGVTGGIQGQLDAKGAIAGQAWTGVHAFPGTTTIGGLTPTIRGFLENITSDAQAQINAKGAIAGQSWTGPHNFTGGSVTVPTVTAGDSSTNAASTAFVAGTAFSAALPGQSGSAGKFVTTDGTSASWQYGPAVVVHVASGNLVVGSVNVATVAGITLSAPVGMSARVPLEFINISPGIVNINFGSYTVKNQTPDSPILVPARRGFKVTNTGSTLA